MKVWVTKYALSTGIFTADARLCDTARGSMIELKRPGRSAEFFHGEGREWHRTETAALERASLMRDAKVRSLEKQLAKIRALRLAVTEGDRQ